MIKWNVTSTDLKEIANNTINKTIESYKKMVEIDIPTYENLIKPLHDTLTEFSNVFNYISLFQYISPNRELRDMSAKMENRLSVCVMNVMLLKKMYDKLKQFKESHPNMSADDFRFINMILHEYEMNGMNLSNEKLKEFMKIRNRIKKLEIKFNNNINMDNTTIYLSEQELNGVPQLELSHIIGIAPTELSHSIRVPPSFINSFDKINDNSSNKYKIVLKPHIYSILMDFVDDSNVRKNIEYTYNTRCEDVNTPILKQLILWRQYMSLILGYNTYSEYVTQDLMIKSDKEIKKFLKNLSTKLNPAFKHEIKELCDENKTMNINQWDINYYVRKIKEKKYNYNTEKIREYFPTDHVINELLNIYQTLFSIKLENQSLNDDEKWEKSITCYKVIKNDTIIGYIYFDLYPRESKYNHAACFTIQEGCRFSNGKEQLPIVAIVANFTPSTNNLPSLLRLSEIITFFHEFGHALHNIFGKTKYVILSGSNVERDFVESASQMLENWLDDNDILKRLSKHYITGQKLDDDIINKIKESKDSFIALGTKRQIVLALFDNFIHSNNEFVNLLIDGDTHSISPTSSGNDAKYMIKKIFEKIYSKIMSFDGYKVIPDPRCNLPASFGHLGGGYDGRYYGYLWSEIIATDMFYTKFRCDLFNKEMGKKYINDILSKGGTVDAKDMIISFLGRDANESAFLKIYQDKK